MQALILYDSTFGNTEQIARAIGAAIGGQLCLVQQLDPADLSAASLLIIGSPTHGGFPTEDTYRLLKALPPLNGICVAAFDTRTRTTVFGYAAPKIARNLSRKGGELVVAPEGFFVLDMQGPLKAGELERAASWARTVAEAGVATIAP